MIFTETAIRGVFIVDLERMEDERGFFARSFCQEEFRARGLKTDIAQSNVSFNHRQGTLRGMHLQVAPKAEAKLVSCARGAVHDVIVDLRPDAPTYCKWIAVRMTEDDRRALYIPKGIAHGFQTLRDNTELFYQMFTSYAPEWQRGVRWDDPAFGIEWPLRNPTMSERDRNYPLFNRSKPVLGG
ncbi:MAG TPA: dTDP-4-dehydrorhamnose 3,5-epimerase [Syntrophorhabdales bacterium]|nr:dTDP-4-dehydrorhamnose 3,5-epimerase [Syntrophorhabdales bacterium]